MNNNESKGQKGFTLVEIAITLSIVGVIGLIVVNVTRYADRQSKIQIEDIQTLIAKVGASKVIQRDLANASPSFNYLNIKDQKNPSLPFFVYSRDEFCAEGNGVVCKREFKLSIPKGELVSDAFFLIVVKGFNKEKLKYSLSVETDVFSQGSLPTYLGINHSGEITKSPDNIESPWIAERLMLLSSNNSYYDCSNKLHSVDDSADCKISCSDPGKCNVAVKRELKMLGAVGKNQKDLEFFPVIQREELLKTNYSICNVNESLGCSSRINANVREPKILFEEMPYSPGMDNGAFFTPVELVRYHLERASPNSPDHEIRLLRSTATISGKYLSFQRAHILMTGAQEVVFTRKNVSNPSIEYKITRAKPQQSIK